MSTRDYTTAANNLHLYAAPWQPATRFVDRGSGKPHWTRFTPRTLLACYGCGYRRWAKNLRVQVFYDAWRFYCRPGKGCQK